MTLSIAIAGVAGRMGGALIRAARKAKPRVMPKNERRRLRTVEREADEDMETEVRERRPIRRRA